MCGLIAITGTAGSAYEVFFGLMNLQHRGQDGAGILSIDSRKASGFHLTKGSGLVENVFSERSFKSLTGSAALGHSRYATVGRNDPNLLQPFLNYERGLGLAHNGNIVNFYALREELYRSRRDKAPWVESDSELILRLLSLELPEGPIGADGVFGAVSKLMSTIVGSYSIICLTKEGDIFGFRDPNGIRPLVFGKREQEDGTTVYAFASETIALDFLGFRDTEEVRPGEVVFITHDSKVMRKVIRQETIAPCMFEWVYFARVESEFEGVSVYNARFKLGQILARRLKDEGLTADVVVPVPETSRASAIAMAEELKIPFRELLIKNRYVNRTFILDDQESRQEAVRRKLHPIGHEFEGKSCLIVDDSIVRGNTARQIVKLVRQAGAREVILVSTCPPIAHPCYYGIDFPSPQELIAHDQNDEEIATALGVDRVIFQTLDGLKSALDHQKLCTGCLTGEYPTDISSGRDFEAMRLKDRDAVLKKSSC
ncbi:MAG TPA: amidophosphoribosyltransferase [Candidatus Obscuribacterales bacterium]